MSEEQLTPPIPVGERGLAVRHFDDLWRIASAFTQAGICQKGDTQQSVFVKLMTCMELGLPFRAMSSLTVINGRVGIMADLGVALVEASGVLADGTTIKRWIEGEGSTRKGVAEARRRDVDGMLRREFSVQDAKLARLWGKSGAWSEYPDRMLMARATGFLLRDHFAGAMLGLTVSEELQVEGRRAHERASIVPEGDGSDPLLAIPQPAPAELPAKLTQEGQDIAQDIAKAISKNIERNEQRARIERRPGKYNPKSKPAKLFDDDGNEVLRKGALSESEPPEGQDPSPADDLPF